MFKWVICLCAAMYGTLMIFGEPTESEAAVAAENESDIVRAVAEVTAEPKIVETVSVSEPEVTKANAITELAPAVTTASLIADSAVETTPVVEPAVQLASVATEVAPAIDPRGVGEIWRVTGKSVNLRAGPSTSETVLGRTRRGDSAEVLELFDSGWARVYVIERGIEAYMSAKFIRRDS